MTVDQVRFSAYAMDLAKGANQQQSTHGKPDPKASVATQQPGPDRVTLSSDGKKVLAERLASTSLGMTGNVAKVGSVPSRVQSEPAPDNSVESLIQTPAKRLDIRI